MFQNVAFTRNTSKECPSFSNCIRVAFDSLFGHEKIPFFSSFFPLKSSGNSVGGGGKGWRRRRRRRPAVPRPNALEQQKRAFNHAAVVFCSGRPHRRFFLSAAFFSKPPPPFFFVSLSFHVPRTKKNEIKNVPLAGLRQGGAPERRSSFGTPKKKRISRSQKVQFVERFFFGDTTRRRRHQRRVQLAIVFFVVVSLDVERRNRIVTSRAGSFRFTGRRCTKNQWNDKNQQQQQQQPAV